MSLLSGPPLDPPTLLFSIGLVAFMMAAFSASAAASMADQRVCLRDWALANLAAGSAFMLFFLRGHIPFWISFLVANAAVLLVPILMYQAICRLVGASWNRRWMLVVLLLAVVSMLPRLGSERYTVVSAIAISACIALLAGRLCLLMWTHPVARTLPAARFTGMIALLTVLTFSWRAVSSGLGALEGTQIGIQATAASHITSLLMGGLFVVAASIAFFSMVHELRRRETADSARRDGLTGLLTRSAFYADAEQRLALGHGGPYAMAMIDLDHFKQVNDGHGHAAGDRAITHMARLVASCVRNSDLVGRYGGEEFVVLLEGADHATALAFGQRLVETVRRSPVRLSSGMQLRCTLSVGVAQGQPPTGHPYLDLEQAIARADTALYVAKAQGRDQVQGELGGG